MSPTVAAQLTTSDIWMIVAIVVLLLLAGMIIPLESLPAPLQAVARLLPAAALSEVLGASLTSGDAASAQAWTVLVVWAVAAPVVAAARFRWE